MRLETFFEKFEQFADAPNAVAKMRELVLELAIEGKLVRSHFDWLSETMGNVCIQITDGEHATPQRTTQGVPLATAKNIRSGYLDMTSTDRVAQVTADKCWKRCKPQHDDLLMVCVGATIGRICRVQAPPDMVLVRSVALIRPNPKLITPNYLELFLLSPTGQSQIWANVKQSAQPCLYLGKMSEIQVSFPPLAEQKRIVAKVDELMALCDRLDAQQQERDTRHTALARAALARFAGAPTPANLNLLFHPSYTIAPADIRKTILTLAVRGKLVPQDVDDEPAGNLLELIEKHRAMLLGSESLRKTKPCRQFSAVEAPHDIPETWVWTMLGEITDIGTGSTPSRTEASFWMGGSIPWITSGSTSNSAITKGDELITAEAVKAHRLRVYPPGTLLVALYGQGKTRGQVATLDISATINQACAAICALKGIAPMQGYLKLLLEKQYDEMRSLATGGAQPNLNVQKIKELFVPLPPLSEQRRIVAKVNQLMALVDRLETQLAASRAAAVNLMDAVVAELTV